MTGVLDDLRLAARRLRRQPGFTTVAVLTLALGLGANTAIYTLVHGLMRQPLPVEEPDGLYRLGDSPTCCVNSGLQTNYALFSTAFYRQAREHLSEFSSLAAFQANVLATPLLTPGSGAAVPVPAQFVSGNYFLTLGVRAAMGRLLRPEDDQPGAPLAFVVSHHAWTAHLGSDPSVIGASMTVGGIPATLVGVTAEGFFGDTLRPDPSGVWLPLGQEPAVRGPASLTPRVDQDWLYVMGRLARGATVAQAGAHATAELRQFITTEGFVPASSRDKIAQQSITVVPAPGGVQVLGQTFGQPLLILFAMSALVLLIASANLANLLLARANRGEAALRSALGASVPRLIRQSLIEGVLLALAGGGAAVFVASAATRAMIALAFPGVAYLPITTGPSPAVLLFALALALLTGIVFTAAPAWAASHTHPIDALRGLGRSGGERAFVPRRSLVIVQVALSLVLLTGAGLLGRSLNRLETQPLGFDTDRRVVLFFNPPAASGTVDQLASLYGRLLDRVSRVPGIESASYSLYSPMEGNNWSSGVSIEGRPDPDRRDSSSWNRIGPRYFETMGTRVLRGRTIVETDTQTSERVAVVNQAFVNRYLAGVDPLTRHLGLGDASHAGDYAIVGVVEDVKYSGPSLPTKPMFFIPGFQNVADGAGDGGTQSALTRSMLMRTIEVRMAPGAGSSPEPLLRRALAEVDPNLTVLRVRTMADQVSVNFRLNRLMSRLTMAYGLLALGLASLGLYGVTAYGVSRRRREIGVRLALGAEPARVIREVLRGALTHTAIGLAIGVPAALGSANLIAAFLYDVAPRDPAILAFAAAALLLSALAAAFLPARRAAAVNPTEALRGD